MLLTMLGLSKVIRWVAEWRWTCWPHWGSLTDLVHSVVNASAGVGRSMESVSWN